jgi:thiamine-monophosphate kinase
LQASGAGARIEFERLPVSESLRALADPAAARRYVLSGGDDYELCFTAPPANAGALDAVGRELGIRVTRIGEVVAGEGITCTENGARVEYSDTGYLHFGASSS